MKLSKSFEHVHSGDVDGAFDVVAASQRTYAAATRNFFFFFVNAGMAASERGAQKEEKHAMKKADFWLRRTKSAFFKDEIGAVFEA